MLISTDQELQARLDPEQVIAAIRRAFASGWDKVSMPQRLPVKTDTGTLLIMPCAIVGDDVCGAKVVSISRDARPEGRIRSSYMLIDTRSGQTTAVFEANYLTDLRTAATTAIATEILARPDAVTLGVFGTGRQAEAHLMMLSRRKRFRHILVAGSSSTKAAQFAGHMRERCEAEIDSVDAETCARSSDVICACTSSEEPLFRGEVVRSGTHLNLIGAFQAHAREVDSALIRRARVFVDTYEAAFVEAGDILVPLEAGEIGREHVRGDLHELVSGLKPGRTSGADITVFKSVGCALEDLVTAKLALGAIQSGQSPALPGRVATS